MADVSKRQRHTALAGEEAVDRHHRDESDEPAVIDDGEIEWFVPVGFAQHLGPGGGVEEGGVRLREEEIVPVGVGAGVDDINVHWVC